MKRTLLIAALALGSLGLTACGGSETEAAEGKTITMEITGMTCEACPPQVKTAIEGLDIVESCDVDLEANTAKVTWKEGKEADTAAIVAALKATEKFEGSVK